MLTGMPISIALGLTVLTFVFTMTTVPIESVALKLFTGIEKFEIMAIPFFILAGNFLTHGGVARRMIDFATSMVGHLHGGLALAGVVACAHVRAGVRLERRDRGGDRLDRAARDGASRAIRCDFGAGVITVAGSLGILMLPSIPKVIYAVATNTSIGALFVAGVLPGHPAHHHAVHGHVVHRAQEQLRAPASAKLGRALARRSAAASGA